LFICRTRNQGTITESALIKRNKEKGPTHKNRQINTEKTINLKLFKFKHMFIKISVDLQTALAAELHPAERQCLKEQLNKKSCVYSEKAHE
jgi:hypothetical protein